MKVVFATDDKETISRMTGRAKWFAFYNIENGEVKDIEYVKNDHTHSHDHSHNHHDHSHNHQGHGEGGHHHHDGHSHKEVIGEIASRDALFITRHLGKHFKEGVIDLGVKYQMTKIESIEDALKNL